MTVDKTETPKELQTTLESQVMQKLEVIPDNVKELMPEGLSTVGKSEWIKKAETALRTEFKPVEQPRQIKESIGRGTPVQTEVTVNPRKLSAQEKITLGLGEIGRYRNGRKRG